MKIAIVQLKADVNSLQDNYDKTFNYINQASKEQVDLICFPEMALCGYDLENVEEREREQKQYLKKLQEVSIDKRITICIGGIEREADDYYIAQYMINAEIQVYRKTHVGRREQSVFSFGNITPIFEVKGVKVAIMTCYDGHFPELAIDYALQGAQIILNPSASPNEPASRVKMWSKYLVARAYDNRVWVLANNLMFNGKGGGLVAYNSNGDLVTSYSGSDEHMEVVDIELIKYSKTMRNRIFNEDRRVDLYGSHNGQKR